MSEEDQFFYANGLEVHSGAFDMTLKFMRLGLPVQPLVPTQTIQTTSVQKIPVVLETISIALAPGQAIVLLSSLMQGLLAFETANKLDKIQVRAEVEKNLSEVIKLWAAKHP